MKSLYVDFDEDKIISNLEDVVPLFPLGNMVFFPNTVIPVLGKKTLSLIHI